MTFPSPTWSRMRAICSSTIEAADHVMSHSQTSRRKCVRTCCPYGRVDDLGVELDPVDAPLDRLEGGDRRLRRRRQRGEALGRRVDGVAVGHPAGLLRREVPEEHAGLVDGELRAPVLPHLGAFDLAAEVEREQLHAVTDAEHRDAELEQLAVELRRVGRVHRRGTAGEDQALRLAPRDLGRADVVREQLGEDPELAHAAGDQLRVLAAVVEDDDLVDRARDVDRRRLVRELRRRDVGRHQAVLVAEVGARHAGVELSAAALSAGAPLASGADRDAAAPRLPIPTPCEVWSSLPSVCSDGAIISSARLNSAMSW